VFKIDDVYHFEKYNPNHHRFLPLWSWVQMIMLLLFVSYLFAYIARIGSPGIFVYGAFIFLMVYANSELMDQKANAMYWEAFKNLFGLSLISLTGDWFDISNIWPFGKVLAIAYFIASTLVVTWFCWQIRQQKKLTPVLS
jgi:uncharacterized membrane protein